MGGRPLVVETLQAMPKTRAWLADGGVTFTQGFTFIGDQANAPGIRPPAALAAELAAARACAGASCP
jgi:hypothetical protein